MTADYYRVQENKIFRRIPKVSLVGIVLRAKSWFSGTSVVKFQVL